MPILVAGGRQTPQPLEGVVGGLAAAGAASAGQLACRERKAAALAACAWLTAVLELRVGRVW